MLTVPPAARTVTGAVTDWPSLPLRGVIVSRASAAGGDVVAAGDGLAAAPPVPAAWAAVVDATAARAARDQRDQRAGHRRRAYHGVPPTETPHLRASPTRRPLAVPLDLDAGGRPHCCKIAEKSR